MTHLLNKLFPKESIKVNPYNVLMFFLGIVLSFGTQFIFKPCSIHPDGSMGPCVTTQKIIFIIGCGIMLIQIFDMLHTNRYNYRLIFNGLAIILFVFVYLIPNYITGVCMVETMRCRTLMLPCLNISSAMGIIVGLSGFVSTIIEKREARKIKDNENS